MTQATTHLRIATRGSMLALWQTRYVADLLARAGVTSELVVIKTTGDKVQDRYLHEVGGKGLFIKELEESLAAGQADIAVHSMKDLPARLTDPFVVGAVLKRHDPRDVLIVPSAGELFRHATIVAPATVGELAGRRLGSSSLRRQSLLRAACPDITLLPLRGNVDTRINKLLSGEFDAMVLALAAMHRLGFEKRTDLRFIPFDPQWFVPCVAQGAISIETTAGHPALEVLAKLNDPLTARTVRIEREILALLGGDCTMPFGCHGTPMADGGLEVRAVVLSPRGRQAATTRSFSLDAVTGDVQVSTIARTVVDALMTAGARDVLTDLGIKV